MIDKLRDAALLDVYGSLLTERQQEILSLYFEEDFSYFEISETLDISRSAVMDAVHKSVAQLERYEEKVGYLKKREEILAICETNEMDPISIRIKDIL